MIRPINEDLSQVSELLIRRTDTVLLSSSYLGSVDYYSALFRAGKAVVELHDNYQKQSFRNRCVIAGANGSMILTVPIEKPQSPKCKTKDILIADHGNWRHIHWNAIVSAYNSTPFFDYYKDDFQPFYEKKYPFLHDFNEMLLNLIMKFLLIETPISKKAEYSDALSADIIDLRELIHPKKIPLFQTKPYYQVFEAKNGFIGNLSIIDMLFNMGNESRLYL